MNERALRLIVWRCISIILSVFITGIMTGHWNVAIGVTVVNSIVLMTMQVFYENAWSKKSSHHQKIKEEKHSGIEFT